MPPEVLARAKPEASMVACGSLPLLPASITAKSGKEQAEYLLNVWGDVVQIHADCRIKHAALADWIKAE